MPNCYPESNPRGGNSARAYFSTPFLVWNTAQTTGVETQSPLRGMRMRAERSMHSRQRNAAEESLQPGIPVRAPRSVLRSPSEKRGRLRRGHGWANLKTLRAATPPSAGRFALGSGFA